jgi:hypothetical protein
MSLLLWLFSVSAPRFGRGIPAHGRSCHLYAAPLDEPSTERKSKRPRPRTYDRKARKRARSKVATLCTSVCRTNSSSPALMRKRQACWHAGQTRLGMNHTILDTKYRTSVRLARSSDDQSAPCRRIGVGTSSQSFEVMHRTRRRLGHTSFFCQSLIL